MVEPTGKATGTSRGTPGGPLRKTAGSSPDATAGPNNRAEDAREPQTPREHLDMGDLLRASSNHEAAIGGYRRALDAGLDDGDKARALKGIGSCLEAIGRWAEAGNVLRDAAAAAEAAGDATELGRIEVQRGKVFMGLGQIEAAIESGDRALQLIDPAQDMSARGTAYNLLGAAYGNRGDLVRSAESLEQALRAFKDAGDVSRLALAYNNLGLVYKERYDWSRALEYLQVASSLQAVEGEYPKRRRGLHNLGLVRYHRGQLDEARRCFRESEEIARAVNHPVGVIRSLLATAGVDLVQKRWKSALESLEQVLELCSEEQYPRETALAYRSLGQLHHARGDLARAQRCLEVAWRKAVEISPESDLVRELLRLRADLALEQGRVEDAASLARRAEELADTMNDKLEGALARAAAGRALVRQGDAAGFEALADAQVRLRRLNTPLPLVQTLVSEARLRLAERADLVRADAVLREARDLLQNLALPELELETQIELASVAAANLDLDRATEYLDQARTLAAQVDDVELRARLEQTQRDLESRLVDTSVTNLGAYRTAGRLEEIIESQRPVAAKLTDVLELVASALEADGAALVSNDPTFPTTTFRIGTATAGLLGELLGRRELERPEVVLDASTSTREPWTELAGSRQATSLMVVPIYSSGPTKYLYLDRLSQGRGSAFGPSHLNLCLALVPHLAGLMDRVGQERAELAADDDLGRRIFLADVVTQNPDMVRILKLVEKVAATDLTVLLQGETGTGKTLIARAIHLTSHRAEGPFVTVDCAALPENLLESELFGFVKGAFTGAASDKKGLFEEADGGTIFLDEIGKAGLGVQRRLLHLLDRGEVRPVGSTAYRKLNVRVICATSRGNLLEEGANGPFIKDLFYRLNDIIVRVPSLSDRPEDIPLLAEYFLETFNAQTGNSIPGFSRAALQRLVRYGWPGNVRELEKVVRRAAILAEANETIGVELLPPEVVTSTESYAPPPAGGDGDLRGTVEEMERRMVREALEKNEWNKTRTAEALGLSRKGLKNKIARYGLSPRRG